MTTAESELIKNLLIENNKLIFEVLAHEGTFFESLRHYWFFAIIILFGNYVFSAFIKKLFGLLVEWLYNRGFLDYSLAKFLSYTFTRSKDFDQILNEPDPNYSIYQYNMGNIPNNQYIFSQEIMYVILEILNSQELTYYRYALAYNSGNIKTTVFTFGNTLLIKINQSINFVVSKSLISSEEKNNFNSRVDEYLKLQNMGWLLVGQVSGKKAYLVMMSFGAMAGAIYSESVYKDIVDEYISIIIKDSPTKEYMTEPEFVRFSNSLKSITPNNNLLSLFDYELDELRLFLNSEIQSNLNLDDYEFDNHRSLGYVEYKIQLIRRRALKLIALILNSN